MYCSLWGGSGEDGGLRHLVLADSPYLVAMALIDQQGRRALPLGGRSQKDVAPQGEGPESPAKTTSSLLAKVDPRKK